MDVLAFRCRGASPGPACQAWAQPETAVATYTFARSDDSLHPPAPSGVVLLENMLPTPLPPSHVSLPGDFVGADLTPERYVVELEAPVRRELSRLAAHATSGALEVRDVHAVLGEATERAKRMLSGGSGVVLLRGVPIEGLDLSLIHI